MRQPLIILLSLVLMLGIAMPLSFAETESDYDSAGFQISDIKGGVRIEQNETVVMSAEEAQNYYKQSQSQAEPLTTFKDVRMITPLVPLPSILVRPKLKITKYVTSAKTRAGKPARISSYFANKTSTPIEKMEVSGYFSQTASVTGSVDATKFIPVFNANSNRKIATSASVETTVPATIQPGKRFYLAFSPTLIDLEGYVQYSGRGLSLKQDFKGTFPMTANGQCAGTFYYIADNI